MRLAPLDGVATLEAQNLGEISNDGGHCDFESSNLGEITDGEGC